MKFAKWFVEQFGKDPLPNARKAVEDAHKLRIKLRNLEEKIEVKTWWDAKRTAALYAWNLKDSDKEAK